MESIFELIQSSVEMLPYVKVYDSVWSVKYARARVCVCVCVTYVYSTLNLFHTIPDADYLRLPDPFTIPGIRQLLWLPCYRPTISHQPVRILELFSSRTSPQYPLYLTKPGRDPCHHRPIHQIWSLTYARPFVARAEEEQAVRPHYC